MCNVARNSKGYTLIELLIVMSIIGILAAISVPNYRISQIKAREAVLRENLWSIRRTIDQYYADHNKYPDSLETLTDKKKNYLPTIPVDPFTRKSDWTVVPPPADAGDGTVSVDGGGGGVYEVHSSSNLVGTNDVPYKDW